MSETVKDAPPPAALLDQMEADAVRRGLWTPDWRKDAEARYVNFQTVEAQRNALIRQEGRALYCPRCNGAAEGTFPLCDLHAELSRLRSDEWLVKAAEEVARWATSIDPITPADPRDASFVLDILRQFRDGAA